MKKRERIIGMVVGTVITVILAPALLALFAAKAVYRAVLVVAWNLRHGRRGHHWLAVYSDGSKWKHHFETEVLPLLGSSCIAINISNRPSWKSARTLERRAHQEWAGRNSHTPILLRFPKVAGNVKEIRFYDAYLAKAKGNESHGLEVLVSEARYLADEA